MRTLFVAAAIGVLLQQPTFRTRVDVVRLDVTVVDDQGRPVRDLRPDDFVVSIDGAPRRVVFAQFYGSDGSPRVVPETAVSVATNTSSNPGRIVVLVADLESIHAGSEKLVFDAAASLLDGLAPSDAVGLLVLPGPGVELTREHHKVRERLKTLRGWAPAATRSQGMSVSEAEAFRNEDRRVIAEVLERECRQSDPTCEREIRSSVMPLLIEADRRTQSLVGALKAVFAGLARMDAPKAVVLLSGGLQRRQDSAAWFNDLERQSAEAGISMSVVQIEQSESDPSRRGPRGAVSRADLSEGLSAVAGATGGTLYHGVGQAAGAFDRIRSEVGHVYQLGVEGTASDADGRKHRLNVQVRRKGVSVRARKELLLPRQPRAWSNPVDVLAQPVDLTEAPLAVAAYMTRGDEPSTLKVIFGIELLQRAGDSGDGSYALTISRDDKVVFETADRLAAGAPTALAAQLAPGRYRVRAAVVDGAGRPGSLHMPLLVGLRQAFSIQFSDLLLGAEGPSFAPATRLAEGTAMTALLELYSADPSNFEGLTVTMEVRRPGEGAPTTRVPAEVRKTAADRRRVAAARVDPAAIPRGTWLVAAITRRGETVIGQVSRTVMVE